MSIFARGATLTDEDIDIFRTTAFSIEREVGRIMVGQESVVRAALIALIAGGHVLLEGVPGLGKTHGARAFRGA